ncbi:MAG: hypothetical protein ACK4VP_04045 [Nitrospira sp.]
METGDLLDAIGGLISWLKEYAAKLPAVVHLAIAPTGGKPSAAAIEAYDDTVMRLRTRIAGTSYKHLGTPLLESLEAFESGRLLGAVQPLLVLLDQMEQMIKDNQIEAKPSDEERLAEYRRSLRKIMPGNKPELEEPRRA